MKRAKGKEEVLDNLPQTPAAVCSAYKGAFDGQVFAAVEKEKKWQALALLFFVAAIPLFFIHPAVTATCLLAFAYCAYRLGQCYGTIFAKAEASTALYDVRERLKNV